MASNRRSFLGRSARLLGGAVVLGPPLLAACGGDDDDDSATTDATAAGTTPGSAAATTPAATTGGSAAAALGTVRTAFNWVPDVEWSAWYLADANGLFADQRRDGRVRPRRAEHAGRRPGARRRRCRRRGRQRRAAADPGQRRGRRLRHPRRHVPALAERVLLARRDADRHRRGPRRQAPRPDDRRRDPRRRRVHGQRPRARLRDRADELRPAAAHRRGRRRHHVLRHEPADPARAAGHRGEVGAVLRLRPEGVRRRAVRVAGLRRGQPRPPRRLLRRPARRGRRQRRRPDGRHPAAHRRLRQGRRDRPRVLEAGNPAYIALLDERLHRCQRSAHDRPRVPGERGVPELRGGWRDRPAARVRAARRDGHGRRPPRA